jgi:hypothetical protein
MIAESSQLDTGMDLRDLLSDGAFRVRPKQRRDPARSASAFRQLSQLLAQDEESVLHELVAAAVEFCGADSAGISLEEPENGTFRWVAIAAASNRTWMAGRREITAHAGRVWTPEGHSSIASLVPTMTSSG